MTVIVGDHHTYSFTYTKKGAPAGRPYPRAFARSGTPSGSPPSLTRFIGRGTSEAEGLASTGKGIRSVASLPRLHHLRRHRRRSATEAQTTRRRARACTGDGTPHPLRWKPEEHRGSNAEESHGTSPGADIHGCVAASGDTQHKDRTHRAGPAHAEFRSGGGYCGRVDPGVCKCDEEMGLVPLRQLVTG